METATLLRWTRACVLSTVVLGATLAAHAGSGGAGPDGSLLVPIVAILTVAAAACLGRPPSPLRIAALLLAGQMLLHAAFELMPNAASTMRTAAHASMGTEAHSGSNPGLSITPTMLVGHLTAALAIGFWLAAVERAAWTLLAVAAGSLANSWRCLRSKLATEDTDPLRFLATGTCPRTERRTPFNLLEPIDSGLSRRGPPRMGLS
jgi:hypothetical protein